MIDFMTTDTFETIMGGLIVLFVVALAIKMGPLRFLGEMMAHLVIKIGFVVMAFGVLLLFANTGIGEALGGVGTGLIVVFAAPFVLLIGAGMHALMRGSPNAGSKDDKQDR